jgi:E3 Ubiquitin ligase
MWAFVTVVLLGLGVTYFLAWRALVHHARSRSILSKPRTSVNALTSGPVRVEGEAVALGALPESPVTGAPCLYFKLVIEERRDDARNSEPWSDTGVASEGPEGVCTTKRKEWVRIVEDIQQGEWGLRDDTGSADVDLFDAELTLLRPEHTRRGLISQCSADLKERLAQRYDPVADCLENARLGDRTRFIESQLVSGDRLVVTGEARVSLQSRPTIVKSRRARLVVSDTTTAELFKHHARRKIVSGVGAIASALLTTLLAVTIAIMPDAPGPRENRDSSPLWTKGPNRFAPVAEPARTPARSDAGRWFVLFRGRDPMAWNTRGTESTIATLLSEAPRAVRFLRLTRLDTGESLIIPTKNSNLGRKFSRDEAPDLPYRWVGDKRQQNGCYYLGIGEGSAQNGFDMRHMPEKPLMVQGDSMIWGYSGSGFGQQAYGDPNRQDFGWRGKRIDPTDFEIAVTAGELSAAEKAVLVKLEKDGD